MGKLTEFIEVDEDLEALLNRSLDRVLTKPQKKRVVEYGEGGWRCPHGKRYWHFYGASGRSLCNPHGNFLTEELGDVHDDEGLHGQLAAWLSACKRCKVKVLELRRWKELYEKS